MSAVYPVPEVDAAELALELECSGSITVLDVRAPERLAQGFVETPGEHVFINQRGSEILSSRDPSSIGLSQRGRIVAVCGHGNSSLQVAAYLRSLGYDASSLRGGMAAYMDAMVPRELPAPRGFQRLVQFDRVGKGALSYLLIHDGKALVVDPPLRAVQIEREAAEAGAEIVGVVDTHVHADFVSGSTALSAKYDVPYFLHPADNCFPVDDTPGRLTIKALEDRDSIRVGGTSMDVMHTPGHTEGSICLLAGNEACFSGDFVFISSIGRPDLAGRTAEWTPRLFNSVRRAVSEWPDAMWVYPAHYGAAGERNPDRTVGRTFGEIKAANEVLSISDSERFKCWVEDRITQAPEQYVVIKAVNAGLQAVSEEEASVLDAGRNECALR